MANPEHTLTHYEDGEIITRLVNPGRTAVENYLAHRPPSIKRGAVLTLTVEGSSVSWFGQSNKLRPGAFAWAPVV